VSLRGALRATTLAPHVIFELLGNSWQIMQVSNLLLEGDSFGRENTALATT
jgi:hypothetical protein